MKIIIFDGTFKTTVFIRRLLQGLINVEHEVFVLGFNEDNPFPVEGVSYIKLGSNQSIIRFLVTSMNWAIKAGQFWNYIKLLLRGERDSVQQLNLAAALDQIQPDIIHLQWISNIPIFEEFLKNTDYRFVLSQRGYQTNVRPFINKNEFDYLSQWLPRFSGFHSVSQAILEKGDLIYNSLEKVNHVVYTGLDLNLFKFSPNISVNGTLHIISVGRPHWIKGYDQSIRAMRHLQLKNINFSYSIVGAENNEELLFLINEFDLYDQIKLLPKLPQQEVFKLIKNANLFLLPSLEEGIANVAVEAMALGTPVISTNCGGMEELITHEKEGWIVPVYDIKGLARQIIEFNHLSEDDILEVVNAARTKVKQQHNEEKMVQDMINLYMKTDESN